MLNNQQVHHYVGIGCASCEQKERCTKSKKRHQYINVHEPWRKKMREKLSSDEGREMYMRRPDTNSNEPGQDNKVQIKRNTGDGGGMMDTKGKRWCSALVYTHCAPASGRCKPPSRGLSKTHRFYRWSFIDSVP